MIGVKFGNNQAATNALDVVEAKTIAGINRASKFLQDELKVILNIPNSGVRKTRTRNTSAGKKGSSYTVYPDPAKPGDPPRKRTGNLQQNVLRDPPEPKEMYARVGITRNAKYGLYLEIGNHPWLKRTALKLLPRLKILLLSES